MKFSILVLSCMSLMACLASADEKQSPVQRHHDEPVVEIQQQAPKDYYNSAGDTYSERRAFRGRLRGKVLAGRVRGICGR